MLEKHENLTGFLQTLVPAIQFTESRFIAGFYVFFPKAPSLTTPADIVEALVPDTLLINKTLGRSIC